MSSARVNRREAGLLVSGLLAAAFTNPWVFAGERRVRPPLWIVERGASRLYLFGQMPVRDRSWLMPEIEAAFTACSELWTENPDADPAAGKAAAEKAIASGPKLRDVATPSDLARVRAVLPRAGLPADALDTLPPSMVALQIEGITDQALQPDWSALPERVLKERARATGKTLHSDWRSFEDVLASSSGLPRDAQLRVNLQMLRLSLDNAEDERAGERRLQAWLAGDLAPLEDLDERIRARYPDAYQRIDVERNAAWASRLSGILERTRVAFVCVGILHLVGPDSIQAHLKKARLRVIRA